MISFQKKKYPRQKLKHQNLESVIVRVDFPIQLRLLSQDPIEFHEIIKVAFPVYEKLVPQQFDITLNDVTARPSSEPIVHKFLTSDGSAALDLSANYFAVTVAGPVYRGFDTLQTDFLKYFDELNKIYGLPLVTRVGLRKVGRHIERGTTKSAIPNVRKLFNPALVAMISVPEIGEDIVESLHRTSFHADAARRLTFQYGLQSGTDASGVQAASFYLDFDCYTETNVEKKNLKSFLSDSNDILWDAYCWAISDEMMGVLTGG